MEKVTCPNGHETTHPQHWEDVSIGYEYSLIDKEFTGEREEGDQSTPVEWACPDCGEAYEPDLQVELTRIMSGA